MLQLWIFVGKIFLDYIYIFKVSYIYIFFLNKFIGENVTFIHENMEFIEIKKKKKKKNRKKETVT